MGNSADGNVGSLFPPACPGNRDYTEKGKPTRPKVPPVRHARALATAEQAASHHLSVRQGGG